MEFHASKSMIKTLHEEEDPTNMLVIGEKAGKKRSQKLSP